MGFTDFFIRRPVFSISLSLLVLLLGVQALFKLQVREYPELTNTTITVSTAYYGAPSEVIQGFITQPLQQAMSEVDKVSFIESKSAMGMSTITLYMDAGADPDAALSEVMAKVNRVRATLPAEALDPSVERSTGASTSIMYLSFVSSDINQAQIVDYVVRNVQPQVITANGVAKADVYGPRLSVRIWIDPVKLAAHDMTASEVVQALQSNNVRAAPGQVESHTHLYNVTADTDLKTQAEFLKMILARKDGGIVRLEDVAEVEINAARETIRAKANNANAVVLAVDPTPTANPVTVARDIKAMLPAIQQNLPSNIEMDLLYDATDYIESSIKEVIVTLFLAAIIVVLTIYAFLGSLRPVVIPVLVIPLSLIGVCLAMQVLGFSINLLTLLAMVLAIGLVVDDAIVVVENVDRYLQKGFAPMEAALKGSREIVLPVIATTLTLVAVYAPIATLGGLTGALFAEFAMTLAGAVVVSSFIALTLSPMMCAYFLRKKIQPKGFEAWVLKQLDQLDQFYEAQLSWCLSHRKTILVFAGFILLTLVPLMSFIPSELAPAEDKGATLIMASGPSGVNLDYVDGYVTEVGRRAAEVEDVQSSLTLPGMPTPNAGFGFLMLKDWGERTQSQDEIVQEIQVKTQDIAGVTTASFPMPVLPGASGGLPVQFVLQGTGDYRTLVSLAQQLQDKALKSGFFIFTDLDTKFETATLKVHVDRDKAGAYGVKMADIADTLSTLMGDGYINFINYEGYSYEVIPQVIREDRLTPESVGKFYVKAVNGTPVPLANLIDWHIVGEPDALIQMNQMNSVTLSAALMPGQAMGDAIAFLEKEADAILPQGFRYDYKGEARQYIEEGSELVATFVLALAVVFLVLSAQFESFRDPMVIMVSVPLAMSGALLAMATGLSTMNIYTQIGLITLVGLMTKHGILMCDVARHRQLDLQETRIQAIAQAARNRLRAVLMTTVSMMAGLLPLLFAVGPGAEARFDIGLVICVGMGIGTLFTLLVLPVVYSLIGQQVKPLASVSDK